MSTIDCVKPTLDPEKLPISEQFSSCHQKAVPLLSGRPAEKCPCISLGLGPGQGSWFLYFLICPFNKFSPWRDLSESLFFSPKGSNCQQPVSPFPCWWGQGSRKADLSFLEHVVNWHPCIVACPDYPVKSSSLSPPWPVITPSGPLVFSSQNLSLAKMIFILVSCHYHNKLLQT